MRMVLPTNQPKPEFVNVRGFSIVGVLIASGMMGGLALYLANISRQQLC